MGTTAHTPMEMIDGLKLTHFLLPVQFMSSLLSRVGSMEEATPWLLLLRI